MFLEMSCGPTGDSYRGGSMALHTFLVLQTFRIMMTFTQILSVMDIWSVSLTGKKCRFQWPDHVKFGLQTVTITLTSIFSLWASIPSSKSFSLLLIWRTQVHRPNSVNHINVNSHFQILKLSTSNYPPNQLIPRFFKVFFLVLNH